jgi:tetratricopeptide (TPR) repeat protein
MQNNFFIIAIFFLPLFCLAQPAGYWDKERATTKEITVGAGNRIILKSEELPIGTTEVVYRITLLDENQQMANSLVSVLKAIPDPTGISQGSAGAVLLLSKISGDDKCTYAIFSSKELAQSYKQTGDTEKACLFQDNAVNKDAKRLSVNASTCMKTGTMWFGFESKNWIMNQRIVLEVVPWVDYKLSRGWSVENRKSVLEICKTTDLAKKIADSDEYCVCVLEKIQNRYRFTEYQALLAVEKTKAFRDGGKSCYTETGASATLYDNERKDAAQLTADGKYAEAISKLQPIISEGRAKVSDYNALAVDYIFTRQYDKALKVLREAEKLDSTELLTQLNIAHADLLKGDYSHAKSIYKKYRLQNATDTLSWIEKVKQDFVAFEKAGLPSTDFKRILNVIE